MPELPLLAKSTDPANRQRVNGHRSIKTMSLRRKWEKWSERRDSNTRPSGPKPDALPGCATLRRLVESREHKQSSPPEQVPQDGQSKKNTPILAMWGLISPGTPPHHLKDGIGRHNLAFSDLQLAPHVNHGLCDFRDPRSAFHPIVGAANGNEIRIHSKGQD